MCLILITTSWPGPGLGLGPKRLTTSTMDDISQREQMNGANSALRVSLALDLSLFLSVSVGSLRSTTIFIDITQSVLSCLVCLLSLGQGQARDGDRDRTQDRARLRLKVGDVVGVPNCTRCWSEIIAHGMYMMLWPCCSLALKQNSLYCLLPTHSDGHRNSF